MPDNTSSNKRIAKNTVFLYIRMAFVMVVTLYTVRVVLNALGEIDYGVYNVVCGFVAMFGVLNTTLSSGTSRFYNYEIGKNGKDAARKVYNTSFFIQLTAAVIVVLMVEIIGVWYIGHKMVIPDDRMEVAKIVFQCSIVSMFLLILQTPYSAAVIAYEKMDFLAIVSILDACLKLSIAFLLQRSSSDKLLLYGVLMMCISIVNYLLYFIFCKIKFKELKLQKGFKKDLFKPMLSFSGWLMLDPIAYTIKGQGSNIALNYYHGPIMNTAYGISNQVAQALESFSGNISLAFKPQMIQSYSAGDISRTKRLLLSMSKIIFILKLLLCVPVVLEADALLHIWLGDTFPMEAIYFSQLMVIIGVVNSFAHPITVVIAATGKMKHYMIVTSLVVSSVLPISIVLMMFGLDPVCVYWTMLFSALGNLLACVIILSKEFKIVSIKDYLKAVLVPCSLHTLVMLTLPLAVSLLLPSSIIRIVVVCVTACISTFISAYCLVLDKTEKNMVMKIVHKFSRRP